MKNKMYKAEWLKQKEETKRLAEEVEKVQDEMAVALANFSDTTDPELLEYYTYYYKANSIKHSYLLKRLKQLYYQEVKKAR